MGHSVNKFTKSTNRHRRGRWWFSRQYLFIYTRWI